MKQKGRGRLYRFLLKAALPGGAALLLAFLFLAPPFPAALSAFAVTNQAGESREIYDLDRETAGELLAALKGVAVQELPADDLQATYLLTVGPGSLFPRHYTVYVTSGREVYFKGAPAGRLLRSRNAAFFYTHDAFKDLYPYGQMPEVLLLAGGERLDPLVQRRTWEYLKWDGNWYGGELPPLAGPGPDWPVFNPAADRLLLKAEPLPGRAHLSVTGPGGETVFAGPFSGAELPAPHYHNGLYHYHLSLYWEDEGQAYRGRYEASFALFMELPPLFELPGTIVQGELAAFYARHLPRGALPVFELELDHRFELFPYADGYVTYLPTHYGTPPGSYRLSYGLAGEPLQETTLVVLPRDFHIQHLQVDSRIVASTRNAAAYEEFNRYFPRAREHSASTRYYSEPFVLPVSGRLTTEFGETRYVNNEPTSYRHSGLDIAAPTGTPVLATGCGRVTLAMYLILTGNTVVIDHGQGLFSVYYHLHELYVTEGQLVARGETIGTVGSTGFSTGPHLHFTISYYRHNLEPGYFLVGEPITYDNAGRHLQGQ